MDNLLQKDKCIVYKGKSYPIDFILLTRRSQFFSERIDKYSKIQNIEISDNGIEIPEDSIKNFIFYCQFEQNEMNITNSNVFSLHQLGIEYNVPGLIQITSNYIATNNKNLVIQSIYHNYLYNQPDIADEDLISTLFFDYINDLMLIKLPIPILYRILNNPNIQKIDDMDDSHKHQVFDFMFKCLDEHKRSASILFKNCTLNDTDIINRLLNDYKDIFDFSMINSETIVKKIPEMLSEMNKMKIEHSKFLSDAQDKFDFFLAKMDELTNIIHIQNEEIGELKKTINLQKKEINDLKEKNILQISNVEKVINDQADDIKQELIILKEEIKNTNNIVIQHENEKQLYVTKNKLKDVLQAGRDKTRRIKFWVCGKTWTNDERNWSNGIAYIGDYTKHWINNGKNLQWDAFEPWDAAISLIQE